jgi:glycosyltransferase involved in cell wall biosynthesis
MLAAADLRAVLSPTWASVLQPVLGNGQTVVLPNPAADAKGRGPRDAQTIAFLGALGERKGIYDLLEATRLLQSRGLQFHLAIAGEGDAERVRAAIDSLPDSSSVRLLGWIPPSAVRELLAGTAIFCLPSHAEGVPLAMLEAMASGCAVVVSPVGGIPDVVTDDVTGLLVPPAAPEQLAEALEALLKDSARRERLALAGQLLIQRRYTVEAVVGRLTAIYASLGYPPVPADRTQA